MGRRVQTYEAERIVVTFDADVCQHSAVCLRGLPRVFDVTRSRWVRPEQAPAEEVAAQVALCPSGALQYRLKEGDTGPARRPAEGGASSAAN